MSLSPGVPDRHPSGPLVTLTTDFGNDDPFVGLVKAAVLNRCRAATIVDLTHSIPDYDTEAAAFWIEKSWRFFPSGTVHVCVVDPGVGTARRILAVEQSGQFFLAPDNGVLAPIADLRGSVVRIVGPACLDRFGLGAPSATFHGRDVFAPLAGLLLAGRLAFGEMGATVGDWQRANWSSAIPGDEEVRGHIVWIDKFGNCFSNIDKKAIVDSSLSSVVVAGRSLPLARTYADHPPGTLIGLVNAFDVLEVACVEGNAASVLGLVRGAAVVLRRSMN